MNKLISLLLAAMLLAACAPAPTPEPTPIPPTVAPSATPIPPTSQPTKPPASPTPAPVEAPPASADELVGIWWFARFPVKVEFKADGTYRIFQTTSLQSGDEAVGNFTVEDGKLTLVTSDPMCAVLPAPTYEAYLTQQDGKPAWLRLQDTGSDACEMRAIAFAGRGKFLGQ